MIRNFLDPRKIVSTFENKNGAKFDNELLRLVANIGKKYYNIIGKIINLN